jgi:hypothetical protein
MSGKLGMWQPTRKDGKNWIVDYSGTVDGKEFTQHRKFRIRADAVDFKRHVLLTAAGADNFEITGIAVNKIDAG